MANRERGEVSLEAGGKTYILRLSTQAMAKFEHALSTPERDVLFFEGLNMVRRGKVEALVAFIWAAMQEFQPGTSIDAAGDFIDACGGIVGLARQIEQLAAASQPAKSDVSALGMDRPQKARAKKTNGTGTH